MSDAHACAAWATTTLAIASALLVTLAVLGPAQANRAEARELVAQGDAEQARGEMDEALRLYERAVVVDPDYLRAYDAAAPLWLRAGRFTVTIAHLERATRRFPDYSFGWYTLAYAYRRVGQHELAVLAYESYIELRPREAAPWFGMAMALKAAGRAHDASAAFARYVEREDDPARRAYVAQARAELAAAQTSADAIIEPADSGGSAGEDATRRPSAANAGDAVLNAAERHLLAGRVASAEASLSGRSGEARVELLRAQIAYARGQSQEALDALYRALGRGPGLAEIYRWLGMVHEAIGRADVGRYYTEEADQRAGSPLSP